MTTNELCRAHLDPNAPEDFAVTIFTTTTIGLSWTAPNNDNSATFAKYRITYTANGNSETEDINDPSTTSFTLTGLFPGVQYSISLVAVSADDNIVSAEASGGHLTVRTKPNAPQSFTGETEGTTTIALTWMAPDSTNSATFDKYRITYSRADGSQTVMINETTSTSFNLTELSPGVQYTISLVTVSDEPNVTVSAEASGSPLTVRTKPNAPQAFAVTSTTTGSVSLNWTTPDSANSAAFAKYRITYTPTGGNDQIKELNETSSTSFTLTELSPGVQYTISLVTVSDEPNVTVSAEASGGPLTVRTKPNAPSGFTETTVNTTAISLSWTAPGSANSATFAKYRITYSANGNSQVKEITDTAATSTTLTGLSPGVLYTISLVAVSADPTVTVSQEAGGGPISVRTNPNAPQDFKVTSRNETTIGLSWSAPNGDNEATFDKYRITYTNKTDSYIVEIDRSSTSTILTDLSPGVLYEISLVSVSQEPDPTESTEASGGTLFVRTSEFFGKLWPQLTQAVTQII